MLHYLTCLINVDYSSLISTVQTDDASDNVLTIFTGYNKKLQNKSTYKIKKKKKKILPNYTGDILVTGVLFESFGGGHFENNKVTIRSLGKNLRASYLERI